MVAICWWGPVEGKHVFTQNKSPRRQQPAAHEITGLWYLKQGQLTIREGGNLGVFVLVEGSCC